MARFSSENQPSQENRVSRNRVPKEITAEAVKVLQEALAEGKEWAAKWVLDTSFSRPKPHTAPDSLDGKLIESQIQLNKERAIELAEVRAMVERCQELLEERNGK